MYGEFLVYLGAFLPLAWGIAHLFPTGPVVREFGEISRDNRNIIAMEWIVEGVALIFIGVLVAAVTYIDPRSAVSEAVYILSSTALVFLAIVSVFTGFRVNLLPFKLCPAIFGSSALLIALGLMMIS